MQKQWEVKEPPYPKGELSKEGCRELVSAVGMAMLLGVSECGLHSR